MDSNSGDICSDHSAGDFLTFEKVERVQRIADVKREDNSRAASGKSGCFDYLSIYDLC